MCLTAELCLQGPHQPTNKSKHTACLLTKRLLVPAVAPSARKGIQALDAFVDRNLFVACSGLTSPVREIQAHKLAVDLDSVGGCSGSPTSQKICFKHVRDARRQRLDQVLLADYRLAWHKCNGDADFVEGIRAKLIEKTGDPKWQPATVHEVRPLLRDDL